MYLVKGFCKSQKGSKENKNTDDGNDDGVDDGDDDGGEIHSIIQTPA